MIQVTPVILCGGSGTRLWPLSRTGFPKQFLCLTGNESLFQQAAQRLATLGNDHIQVAAPVIVSGEDHRFLASEQLREVGIALGTALLEPVGRNTAHDLGCIGHCAKWEKPRSSCHPCRTNHRQAIGLHCRLATSHYTSRAEQHRHLGRHTQQTRNQLRLHPHRPKNSAPQGSSVTEQSRIFANSFPLKSKRCLTTSVKPSKNWHGCQRSLRWKSAETVTLDIAKARQHALLITNVYIVNFIVE